MEKNPLYFVSNKYDPVFMEPPSFLKEYETQVRPSIATKEFL